MTDGKADNFEAGHSLGHYRIVKKIGAGGMGEVYLAEDTRLRRKIALKILPENIAGDKDRRRRFEQEAFAASSLNHPNILTIYEFGAENETHFLAAEFVEGITLRQRLQESEAPALPEVLDIAIQIAAALNAAHQAGIVHRDLKPENVMIRHDRVVKVLDFGLAKMPAERAENLDAEAQTRAQFQTAPGMILGTAAYMSPEQARGKTVDARSDVFSFGIVLYELLSGTSPFVGDTFTDTIAAILTKDPPAPAHINRQIPAELERIVLKTLEKDIAERYQSAGDLLVDLRHLKKQIELSPKIAPAAEQPENAGKSANDPAAPNAEFPARQTQTRRWGFIALLLILAAAGAGWWFFPNAPAGKTQIESIAVMPFVNESGSADNEYLSDGMTESLINSLSQLPRLSVKARSSVFRYKGKDVSSQKIGSELSVQAVLFGRVIQRGEQLTLSLELVDALTQNVVWSENYNRRQTDLLSLQSEIARDVSNKLKIKLSGADELRVTKDYTSNAEAYQLYLRGRYHVFKVTPPEVYKAISYFQQAIAIDPNYALAYAGLSDAYRSLALAGELLPTEFLPKAKEYARKAVEIDDSLSEAHTTLGMNLFWYDRDWNAAENQFKRALELNPNDANAHLFYAHLLSNTARHDEALVAVRRARELDPVSPFVNALEGQFLLHAGRIDESLASLQKTFEMEPDFWMAHLFAASAYIEKGMYEEAVIEARKARAPSTVQTVSFSFEIYALAKSGKTAEARRLLDDLLKTAAARFVPPCHIALAYNGLGERAEALAWLERALDKRDPKITFLKVDPKWNNLRSDPGFQDILRRAGFAQ